MCIRDRLGAYWNTKVKPPYVIQDGKVYDFTIKMPSGTELHLYDEPGKQKVTLTMPSGTTLTMDDEGKKVALQDKGGENALTMDLQGGNVELKAKTCLLYTSRRPPPGRPPRPPTPPPTGPDGSAG